MPIIPITILAHKIWAFVDSGATFTLLRVDEAHRLGIDWNRGRRQMIVVGNGSFIPTYIHDLSIHLRVMYGSPLSNLRREVMLGQRPCSGTAHEHVMSC